MARRPFARGVGPRRRHRSRRRSGSAPRATAQATARRRPGRDRRHRRPRSWPSASRSGACAVKALATEPQPESAQVRRYNPSDTDRDPTAAAHAWPPPWKDPPDDPDRPACHRPSASRREALHLCLGRRSCRGRCVDARPARGQGRRSGRDDQRRPAGPARLHDHHGSLQRLLHGRPAAARRPVGRRPRGGQGGRGAVRQGLRRCRRSAPRVGPLRGEVLHARDDGHGPQSRAQRGDAARARRADRQRALWLGRLPALHPDVRADRHGREGRAVRHRARGGQARPGRPAGHRPGRRRPADARRGLQGHRARGHRPGLPERPVRAARPGHQGRLRQLVRQARGRLPEQPEDRPRPGHGGQRRDHGLRQHGRRLGDRRRVHPRPEHRREDAVRRVPHQRPGRGRRGRHPDRAQDRPDADRHAGRLRRVPADRPAARAALPRRPGPRVHDRARQAVHAPDPERQADRGGGGQDRRRHGRGGPDHAEGRGRAGGARPGGPAPPGHVRPSRPGQGDQDRERSERLTGGSGRAGRVRRRHGRRMGRPRRKGDPRPDRDLAGRLPRHGRGRGDHHRPRRSHVPRGRRRAPDRQAMRGGFGGPDRRLCRRPGALQRHGDGVQGG